MKKILSALLILAMTFSMVACNGDTGSTANARDQEVPSSAVNDITDSVSENNSEDVDSVPQNDDPENAGADDEDEQGGRILVAYFSRSDNIEIEIGVDTVASASINVVESEYFGNAQLLAQMAQEVTGGDLFLIQTEEKYPSAYRATTDIAKEEQNENARPALATHVENMDQYDTIVLVYPNWWGTLPMPLFTFLEEYDFSGKTILPLCTHEGSRMGSSERAITELCPGVTLLGGLAVRGSDAPSARSDVETWLQNSGI